MDFDLLALFDFESTASSPSSASAAAAAAAAGFYRGEMSIQIPGVTNRRLSLGSPLRNEPG